MDVERDWGRLGWGLLLMLLGALFMLERYGWIPEWSSFHWWPLIVMFIGLWRLIRPTRARHVGSGVTLLLLGGWFLAASNDWHGLDWHNSWPLALVAVGAGMVARAIAARWLPDRWWR